MFLKNHHLQKILCFSINYILFVSAIAQVDSTTYSIHKVAVNDIELQYLDFGGEGLPVVLVPSGTWNAGTYKDFGPLFNDTNRVFAVTKPGYGDGQIAKYDIPSQGDYLIGFLDALGIERAVFMASSSATTELTYLAENYPKRVAGVVYLSGLGTPWIDIASEDPNLANEMYLRAVFSEPPIKKYSKEGQAADQEENTAEKIKLARESYRPKLSQNEISIEVPALAFTSKDGRLGYEKDVAALVFAGSRLADEVREKFPPSPIREDLDLRAFDQQYRDKQFSKIQDSTARDFFIRLARDTVQQRAVLDFHLNKVYPAILEAQDQMIKAFGKNLQLVKLDIPMVVGYEYRDNPELIVEPIRQFLLKIR